MQQLWQIASVAVSRKPFVGVLLQFFNQLQAASAFVIAFSPSATNPNRVKSRSATKSDHIDLTIFKLCTNTSFFLGL